MIIIYDEKIGCKSLDTHPFSKLLADPTETAGHQHLRTNTLSPPEAHYALSLAMARSIAQVLAV